MSQHYTRSTISAAVFCTRCGKETQHRIDDRRVGPCMECMARTDELASKPKKNPPARQDDLFGGAA
jgi:NMD protein affecting ribosome stability and mRNA decay